MNKSIVTLFLLALLLGCENQDWSFPDHDYTTVYFPYQYPVRTLVLGDYIYPNDNDNNHKFLISAAMGGVYSNTKDRVINISLDEDLCTNARFNNGNTIRVLPSSYYELSSTDKIIIPAGKFNGNIEVQLTNEFFSDPLSIGLNYVIPMRIESTADIDSVLQGSAEIANPDPRILTDWETPPKNFTLFAINYINPYHGVYLRRGEDMVRDNAGNEIETIVYRQKYVEYDEVIKLETRSLNQVIYTSPVRRISGSSGNFSAIITFSENGDCTIAAADGSPYTVTGSGKYVKDGDEWGNQKRNVIHLNYQITEGANTHFVNDTLVIRDRAVKLETFTPEISN
jgi:hypothetical protein